MTSFAVANVEILPPETNPKIQDYLSVDRPCGHAVQMCAHMYLMRTICQPDPIIADRLRRFCRLVLRYGRHITDAYSLADVARFDAILARRGQSLRRPKRFRHGPWHVDLVCRTSRRTINGERFLTIILHDDETLPVNNDDAMPNDCVGWIDMIEHVLGHWEISHFDVAPDYRGNDVATLLHDLIDEILPLLEDCATLAAGHVRPMPPGLLTVAGHTWWQRREPEMMSTYSYLDLIDCHVSYRQLRILQDATRWEVLDGAYRDPAQPLS